MSRPVAFLALGFVGSSLCLAGCAKDRVVCTPETAGLGDQARLVRQALAGLDSKPDCVVHVDLVRTQADLDAAYAKLGLSAPTTVDFARQTVVLREALDTQPIAWIVGKDGTVTIGSQACAGAANGTCSVTVFSVDGVLTKAEAYACEDIGCSGTSASLGSGG